jgi:N-acetyl-gamma-glutamyl-phosphate reductase
MQHKIKAGIIGAAGYTGGEMIRLLINHPAVTIEFINSKSNTNKYVYEVHKDLLGDTTLKFTDDFESAVPNVDVVFLCVGHGDAKVFLENNNIPLHVKVIDLSQDFRLVQNQNFRDRNFIYGLPELNKDQIKHSTSIANPGCFATAIQLGLLPLAKENLLGNVYTTGITGSTGAGQSLSVTSHFSWRCNNISAYKTLEHQHINEITQSVNQLQRDIRLSTDGSGEGIWFVPWRGDFSRGIYVSSTLECKLNLIEANNLFHEFYQDAAFTHVSNTMIDLKQVVNSNKCLIHIEKVGNKIVVHSAIDNLLKGASGQAVQNMNIMFGLDEKEGLNLKANYF